MELHYFLRLQEKTAIRELMAEEHQVAKRDLQYRLKLAEDEQNERLKAVINCTAIFDKTRIYYNVIVPNC